MKANQSPIDVMIKYCGVYVVVDIITWLDFKIWCRRYIIRPKKIVDVQVCHRHYIPPKRQRLELLNVQTPQTYSIVYSIYPQTRKNIIDEDLPLSFR